jgi:NAD(P)-dependent dehydrogenase (short-subunit alcohol dehydrogenase family)
MADPASRAVLVTGCSSGIGEATAARLAAAGWPVYATARRPETLANLEAAGCRTLALDVTDEASMQDAVAEITREHGAVGVLVNNAGYSQSGPIEEVPLDAARRQFETNVFGPMRLAQLVLPGMREQRWGRIVNLSSMGANFTFPGGGWYHATKHALDALSDALRFEVAGFGVHVVIVQPGLITTRFGETAATSIEEADSDGGPYGRFNAALATSTRGVYENPVMARLGGGPDAVAQVIEKAISARRPRARYLVTPSARLMTAQRKLLPDRAWDALMRTQFRQPRQR